MLPKKRLTVLACAALTDTMSDEPKFGKRIRWNNKWKMSKCNKSHRIRVGEVLCHISSTKMLGYWEQNIVKLIDQLMQSIFHNLDGLGWYHTHMFWIATHISFTERGGFTLKVQISLYAWHIPGSTAQDCACNLQHSRLKHQEQTYLPAKHQSDWLASHHHIKLNEF